MQASKFRFETEVDDYLHAPHSALSKAVAVHAEVYETKPIEPAVIENIDGLAILTAGRGDLQKTPIANHVITVPTNAQLELVRKAMRIITTRHAADWIGLRSKLAGLMLVRLNPDHRTSDSQVTSISLPGLPFISLISDKAFVHAPPSLIVDEPSEVILAENILHEAVHQLVNATIVDSDILPDSYDSTVSPRIEIPWRTTAFYPRDRSWPLDRCLHAASVYLMVLRFRKRERATASIAQIYEPAHVKEALDNGQYLASQLLRHSSDFAESGKSLIREIFAMMQAEA